MKRMLASSFIAERGPNTYLLRPKWLKYSPWEQTARWAAPEVCVDLWLPWLPPEAPTPLGHSVDPLFFLALRQTTLTRLLVPDLLPPASKGFGLYRRGTSQRTGMAAARHLRSGLPLLRAHLASSESAAVAQVLAPCPPFSGRNGSISVDFDWPSAPCIRSGIDLLKFWSLLQGNF